MSILTIDIVWPAELPLPFVDYAGANRNATISSSFDDGPIVRRSRFDKFYVPASVSWRLTEAQYAAFQTFFADTLGNGAAAFSLELRYPKNSALSVWMVRFIGGYSCEYLEGIWSVTGRIDLIDKSEVDAEAELVGYVPFEVEDGADHVPYITSEGFEFWVIE